MYINKYEILDFDIEVIANVVRGLTNSPDIIDDDDFELLL
jgi:hypothetical protein